jgi:hypothetical protein
LMMPKTGSTVCLRFLYRDLPSSLSSFAFIAKRQGWGSGSNGTKTTIGDTGTARHVSFLQKTYL